MIIPKGLPFTREKINKLVMRYFVRDKYTFPDFKHDYDIDRDSIEDWEREGYPATFSSSAICYSLIRHLKPQTCLEFGTCYGGATCIIQSALRKNAKPFSFIASEQHKDVLFQAVHNVFEKCGSTPMFIEKVQDNLDIIPSNLEFVFIDTDHDKETTEWYIDNIFPRCKKGALIAIHDWAVKEEGGEWVGKGHEGAGGLPETQVLMDLHKVKKLPLEKLYWNYKKEGSKQEASFWLYKP